MINMLRADAYRLFKTTAVYIGIFLMLLMMGVSIYEMSPGYIGSVDTSEVDELTEEQTSCITTELEDATLSGLREAALSSGGFALDRQILAVNANLYYIFIFIIAIAITSDFSSNAAKNTLSSAISRGRYFVSKVIFVNIFCVLLFLINNFGMYFLNIIFNGSKFSSDISVIAKITLMQLMPILAFISIQTALAFILRRAALFNTAVIPLLMVFQLVLAFVQAMTGFKEGYMRYELQAMISSFAAEPSRQFVINGSLVCLAIIVLCYLLSCGFFKKAEIK